MLPLQKEGRAKILGVSAAQRQTGALGELVTLKEQGYDAVFFTWRGFMAPKGLKAPEIAYWDTVSQSSRKATNGARTPSSSSGTPITC
jgi:putative tricarboxylic transport membrane protein